MHGINDRHSGGTAIPSGDWRQHRGRDEAFINRLVAAYYAGDEKRLARLMANSKPFAPMDSPPVVSEGLLADAACKGKISERQLAQAIQKWVVVPS
ncbi:MAG TPA: hypothetical protein VN666_18970 [Nitrospira sp.]|nr:hypothetical protein [Nitrospira sp.]